MACAKLALLSARLRVRPAGPRSARVAGPLARRRPPGRLRRRTRPTVLARVLHQPRAHRIVLDITANAIEFALVSDIAIECLFLPEWRSRLIQQRVGPLRSDAFQRSHQLG